MISSPLAPKVEETVLHTGLPDLISDLYQITDSHIMPYYEDDPAPLRSYFDFARQWFFDNWTRSDRARQEDIFSAQVDYIREHQASLTVLSGDMICGPGRKALETLAAECRRLGQYMYIPGNHDWKMTDDLTGTPREEAVARFAEIVAPADFDFQVRELNGVNIIGINNSNYQVTAAQTKALRRVFEEGKPCLLFLHIPLYSEGLMGSSEGMWQAPLLCGLPRAITDRLTENTAALLTASEESMEFYRLTAEESNPLLGIFSGHLHFSHEAPLPNGVPQYVTDMGVNGTIRCIHLVP